MKARTNKGYIFGNVALLCLLVFLPLQSFGGYILDQNFGEGGIQTTAIGTDDDRGTAATLQPDGKIVVVGTTAIDTVKKIAVLRYNSDGSEDTAFNANTVALQAEVGSFNDQANSVVVLDTGEILVAGYSEDSTEQEKDIIVLRLTAAGILDQTFGVGGIARLEVTDEAGEAFGLVVDSQNRIVVGGTLESESRSWAVAARFLEDGTLDSSGFGENGYRKVEFTGDTENTSAFLVGLQSDEKIVLGGTKQTGAAVNAALFRLDENGAGVDSSFGEDGLVVIDASFADSAIKAATILADDSIVATGFTTSNGLKTITAAKFSADGILDTTFGIDGFAISVLDSDSEANDIAEKSDASFVIAGVIDRDAGNDDMVLIELDSTGNKQNSTILTTDEQNDSQETTEDIVISPLEVADGVSLDEYELVAMQQESSPVTVDINGDDDSGQALVVTEDGNVILVGFASDGNTEDVALVSLVSDSGTGSGDEVDFTEIPFLIGTIDITNVQRNSAMSGGVITENKLFECEDEDTCLPTITERGVVFSITPFPSYLETTTDGGTGDTDGGDGDGDSSNSVFPDFLDNTSFNHDVVRRGQTADGSGKGTYGSDINEITPDTVYYVRAYAVLSSSTDGTTTTEIIYGNQLIFKTDDACFIATAAFGSPLAPHIAVLSEFRDTYLKTSELGRKFVYAYYHYSPPLADFISQSPLMRFVVRLLLLPLVGFSYFMVNFSLQLKLLLIVLTAGSFYCSHRLLLRR